jgi:hypothetical protein
MRSPLLESATAGRRVGRAVSAWLSIVLGLAGVAAVPAAIAVTERRADLELIYSAAGIPVALLCGLAAMLLARRGRRRSRLTVSGRGGRPARIGNALGLLALLLAGTAALAVGWYAVLTWQAGS